MDDFEAMLPLVIRLMFHSVSISGVCFLHFLAKKVVVVKVAVVELVSAEVVVCMFMSIALRGCVFTLVSLWNRGWNHSLMRKGHYRRYPI